MGREYGGNEGLTPAIFLSDHYAFLSMNASLITVEPLATYPYPDRPRSSERWTEAIGVSIAVIAPFRRISVTVWKGHTPYGVS